MLDNHVAEHENYRSQQLQAFSEEQSLLLNQSQGADGGAPPPADPGLASPRDGGAGLNEIPETEGMANMAAMPQMQPSGYTQ